MKLLLHICCAPCSAYPIKYFKEENVDVTGYFYNPNIHPYSEYKNRLDALISYSKMINLNVIYDYNYGVIEFTRNVVNDVENRCNYCYLTRMEKVVKYAKEKGYDAFSSTLFVSPYQKHELLKNICEELSKKYDIPFLYKDFRENYYDGQRMFKETGLYMQKYCGCIFSEMFPKLKEINKSSEMLLEHNKIVEKRIRLENIIKGLNIRNYNSNDYEFIYNVKKYNNLTEKENKKLVDKFINKDLKIITINDKYIGYYLNDLYLIDEYKNIESLIADEIE